MAKTEITVQIFEDENKVDKNLLDLGYTKTETFTGSDTYFSSLSEDEIKEASYKDLLGTSIIIRSFLTNGEKERQNYMVFKNKDIDKNGNVVSEEKVSTQIMNPNNAIRILKLAKLNNWVSLNQQNSFYVKDEQCITVGTVEGLEGLFVEIEEFDSMSNWGIDKKIEELKRCAQSFNFKLGNDYSVKKVFELYKKNKEVVRD